MVEFLDYAGRSTPFLYQGWVHLHLAINGHECPSFQIIRDVYDRDFHTMAEGDFWEQTAEDALMHQQALQNYREGGHAPARI